MNASGCGRRDRRERTLSRERGMGVVRDDCPVRCRGESLAAGNCRKSGPNVWVGTFAGSFGRGRQFFWVISLLLWQGTLPGGGAGGYPAPGWGSSRDEVNGTPNSESRGEELVAVALIETAGLGNVHLGRDRSAIRRLGRMIL